MSDYRYNNNDKTQNNPIIPERNPILSLSNLSEQHHEIFISKLNTLHAHTNETRTSNDSELDIAEMISKQIDTLGEMMLHLETSRTLLLTQTITRCPNCRFDLTTRRQDRTEPI